MTWKLHGAEESSLIADTGLTAALLLLATAFPFATPALLCTAVFFTACFVTGALSSFLLFTAFGTLAASTFSFFLLAITNSDVTRVVAEQTFCGLSFLKKERQSQITLNLKRR
jgi:hypothetical protein